MWITESWTLSKDKTEVIRRLDISLELIGSAYYGAYRVETLKSDAVSVDEFKARLEGGADCEHLLPKLLAF